MENSKYLIIDKEISLKEFISLFENPINKKSYKIAVALSKKNKVEGIFSRGDLRRTLIKKINLNQPLKKFLNKNFFSIKANNIDTSLYSNIKRFTKKKTNINEIIILDQKNKFKNILELKDLIHNLKYRKICILGLGYIGLPLLLFLSTKFKSINGFDNKKEKINNLKKNKINIYEKGLEKLLSNSLSQKKLLLSYNLTKVKSDVYIICIGTDVINKKPNNLNLLKVADQISKVIKKDDLVILRGTVQVGFTQNIFKKVIEKKTKMICGKDFFLGYMPERLVEGNAIEEIRLLPQVFAGISKECKKQMTNFVEQVFSRYLSCNSVEEAELIKLTSNAFRDLNFAFSNQISKLSRKFNLSGSELIDKANYGYERNSITRPSLGVGGHCLTKDPILLSKSIKSKDYKYLFSDISLKSNEDFLRFNMKRISMLFKKNFNNKKIKILIFGISFKSFPENIDTRNSVGLRLGNFLEKQKLECHYFDKKHKLYNQKKLKIKIISNLKRINNYDGVIIVNEHKDFSEMIYNNLSKNISKNKKIIFDTWNNLDKNVIKNLNWEYYNI